MIEELEVGLGQKVRPQSIGQFLNQLSFLSIVELLPDFGGLDNVVGDLLESRLGDCGATSEGVEDLEFVVFLDLFLFDKVDKVADIVDVVAEEEACAEGDYDDEEGLDIVARMQIAKADG
jgi:hypothetical protein